MEDPPDEAGLPELTKRTLDYLVIAWKSAVLEGPLFQRRFFFRFKQINELNSELNIYILRSLSTILQLSYRNK